MIARVQIKGNAAEVVIDEFDEAVSASRKKWFAEGQPEWKSLDSAGHVSGVIFDKSLTIILMDGGTQFISYKPGGLDEGRYSYSYLYKKPSEAGKVVATAVEYSQGIVFDSGDFECPDNTSWGACFSFDIVRLLGTDAEKGDSLDLELVTAVYFEGGALNNIATPAKKKTPKLYKDSFISGNPSTVDETAYRPSWL